MDGPHVNDVTTHQGSKKTPKEHSLCSEINARRCIMRLQNCSVLSCHACMSIKNMRMYMQYVIIFKDCGVFVLVNLVSSYPQKPKRNMI